MLEIDIPAAYLSGSIAIGLSSLAMAFIKYGEAKQFKENIQSTVANNYKLLKEEIDAHEDRDNQRHTEVLDRIGRSEDHIIELISKK